MNCVKSEPFKISYAVSLYFCSLSLSLYLSLSLSLSLSLWLSHIDSRTNGYLAHKMKCSTSLVVLLAYLSCTRSLQFSGLLPIFAHFDRSIPTKTRPVDLPSIILPILLVLSPSLPGLALTPEDTKINKGYDQISGLLDDWVAATTNCKTNNDNPYQPKCERTPLKVMEVLGYKSMTSPLFNAEKTLLRIQINGELDKVLAERWGDDDKKIRSEEIRYQAAVDSYLQSSDEGSGLAYISSWGEANPGGGKDRIELFIERSKQDVINCKKR